MNHLRLRYGTSLSHVPCARLSSTSTQAPSPTPTAFKRRDWRASPLGTLLPQPTPKSTTTPSTESKTRRTSLWRAPHAPDPTPTEHVAHRQAMKEQFPDGWNPPRKLSREAMEGLRTLHAHNPHSFTTAFLAQKFRISPEAVRRILKSRWTPSKERTSELVEREKKMKTEVIRNKRMKERELSGMRIEYGTPEDKFDLK